MAQWGKQTISGIIPLRIANYSIACKTKKFNLITLKGRMRRLQTSHEKPERYRNTSLA
jgi:hypothetical protein